MLETLSLQKGARRNLLDVYGQFSRSNNCIYRGTKFAFLTLDCAKKCLKENDGLICASQQSNKTHPAVKLRFVADVCTQIDLSRKSRGGHQRIGNYYSLHLLRLLTVQHFQENVNTLVLCMQSVQGLACI